MINQEEGIYKILIQKLKKIFWLVEVNQHKEWIPKAMECVRIQAKFA